MFRQRVSPKKEILTVCSVEHATFNIVSSKVYKFFLKGAWYSLLYPRSKSKAK
jgi:hypothetical protein